MTFDVWEAIARKQVRFRDVLKSRMEAYSEEQISTCSDVRVLESAINLAGRVERHQRRMDRHMQRGFDALMPGAKAH